jgi:hypothetical protein
MAVAGGAGLPLDDERLRLALARFDTAILDAEADLAEELADREPQGLDAWCAAHEKLFGLIVRRDALLSTEKCEAWIASRKAALVSEALAKTAAEEARETRRAGLALVGAEREKPTVQRAKRSSRSAMVTEAGAVFLGGELPETVRRLVRAGRVSARDADALARARGDWLYGFATGSMVGAWDPGSGVGLSGETESIERQAARERWERAIVVLTPGLRVMLKAVLVDELTLDAAPAPAAINVRSRIDRAGALFEEAAKSFAEAYRSPAERRLTARAHSL